MKRIAGLLSLWAYKLDNHSIGQIPLRNWTWAWIIVPPLLAVFRRLSWWYAIPAMSIGMAVLIGVHLIQRNNYILFEPGPLKKEGVDKPPIKVDEQVEGWASGLFAVGEKKKQILAVRAFFSFVPTREHVVMARIDRTRFLLLATSNKAEEGWWYVFFKPELIRQVETGHLFCGLGVRPTLALAYAVEGDPGKKEAVYLTFADLSTLWRVVADLRMDTPEQAFKV